MTENQINEAITLLNQLEIKGQLNVLIMYKIYAILLNALEEIKKQSSTKAEG